MTSISPAGRRPGRFRPAWVQLAVVGVIVGALIAVAGGIYLLVSQRALATLDDYEVEVPADVRQAWVGPPAPAAAPVAAPGAAPGAGSVTQVAAAGAQNAEVTPASEAGRADEAGPGDTIVFDYSAIYPADQTNPRFWANPEFAGTGPYGSSSLPDGFEAISAAAIRARDRGPGEEAARIMIPAIGIDEPVAELQILDEPGGARYQQPVKLVGHIPETPNPGQSGNGWYFGHLESPILGEGNVFRRLPEIAGLIKQDPVDVILVAGSEEFLYRVTRTSIIPKEDLTLYRADLASITLVASFPSRVYSHRFLVTAELIAERPVP